MPLHGLFYFILNFKNDTFENFIIFKVFVEVFTLKKIKTMDGDIGYKSNAFKTCCENNGIKHQMTTSYMLQQNCFAKWKI